jgi:hypothetical protein
VVTTLNSTGTGSFRQALLATGPRIIVFRVSGVIDLGFSSITMNASHSYLTVLGQSSPGGITVTNGTIHNVNKQPPLHDVIFRFFRIRGPQNYDNISFNPVHDLIIDHMDFSGGKDEAFDITHGHDWTVQWSTIANSVKAGSGSQNYGSLIAYTPNTNISIHHNLNAHHLKRCGAEFHWTGMNQSPLIGQGPLLDIRNNVAYNCGINHIYAIRTGLTFPVNPQLNVVGNYAKAGVDTPKSGANNLVGGNEPSWGRLIFTLDNQYPGYGVPPSAVAQPYPAPPVTTTTSNQAYMDVLNYAGSWPRDAMTTRTVNDVKNGTGTLGMNSDPFTTTGPTPPPDADLDGIADSWETANGLNPNDPLDSAQIHSSGYAHVEVYLNQIARQITGQTPPPPPPPPAPPVAPRGLRVQ